MDRLSYLREYESVGRGVLGCGDLVPHSVEEQHGHDLRHGRT